jgi:Ca-activated chloride channel family protein
VVLVIDYSKSMYARDVSPSRIERAKVEVSRLISELSGARFGAVAFAGETMSFPLTSDGAAIAQFFRSLTPADMPVGGTGIARALVAGRELLARDPLSERHERVIVLVTDGEDLEGDPVAAAREASEAGIGLEIVQIGGLSPEPIPDIDEDGQDHGLRRDRDGKILTTSLSAEGQAQLGEMASLGGGSVVRAKKGHLGIDVITDRLHKLMTEELSERVETVYADVYHFPLIAVIVLLVLESLIGPAKKRRIRAEPPPGQRRKRKLKRMQATAVLLTGLQIGCQPFDDAFERNNPVVEEAISALNAGEQERATNLLVEYLETGPCEASVIGAGDRARRLGDASLDLALALAGPFPKPPAEESAEEEEESAEEEEPKDESRPTPLGGKPPLSPPGAPSGPGLPGQDSGATPASQDPEQNSKIECALRLLSPVVENRDHPVALRARALYLMGNLELSRGNFEDAVTHYDRALGWTPGTEEGQGDSIGRRVAHNRALALRLEEAKQAEEEQQNSNSSEDDSPENQEQDDQDGNSEEQDGDSEEQDEDSEEQDGDSDREKDQEQSQKDEEAAGDDQNGGQDGEDDQEQPDDQGPEKDQAPPSDSKPNADEPAGEPREGEAAPRPSASQDTRILDRLEQAPTLQQHDAKKRAGVIRTRPTMEDK